MKVKNCIVCGEEFRTMHPTQSTCKPACSMKRDRIRPHHRHLMKLHNKSFNEILELINGKPEPR